MKMENPWNQSIVPSSITRKSQSKFEVNMMGFMTDYNFYIPDQGDSTGMAFSVSYNAATRYRNEKDLCTCVGSMLCCVVPGFRNSVETALNGIGVRPRFVSLPSQAEENNIVMSNASQLDWPSILVIFGYCALTLFKIDNIDLLHFDRRKTPNKDRILELQAKVGFTPRNYLHGIPFDQHKEKEVSTMLGTHAIRTSVITFLMNNFDHLDSQICSLCQYLSYVLSWSGDMRILTLMNKWLVKTNSPVLAVSSVKEEVDNLEETIKTIRDYTYPQYFSHICSVSELFYLDVSRFPTLFAVAIELEKGSDGSDVYSYSKVNSITLKRLVKLHLSNIRGFSSVRCLPSIPGI